MIGASGRVEETSYAIEGIIEKAPETVIKCVKMSERELERCGLRVAGVEDLGKLGRCWSY